jgi:hypothetical protein
MKNGSRTICLSNVKARRQSRFSLCTYWQTLPVDANRLALFPNLGDIDEDEEFESKKKFRDYFRFLF